jgi:uncharacterized protein HemY
METGTGVIPIAIISTLILAFILWVVHKINNI